MEKIKKYFETPKAKKYLRIAIIVGVVFWFLFRFVMVALESRMTVFNPIRELQSTGAIVDTVIPQRAEPS